MDFGHHILGIYFVSTPCKTNKHYIMFVSVYIKYVLIACLCKGQLQFEFYYIRPIAQT